MDKSIRFRLRLTLQEPILSPLVEHVNGTIKRVDPTGHGIIQTEDGSKLSFLFVDVLTHRALAAGERVIFSIRTVQGRAFAQNISYDTQIDKIT